MTAILVLAEHDLGRLSPVTARLVAAVAAFGSPVDVLVAGSDIAAVATDAATLPGVARVLLAASPALAGGPAVAMVPLLATLAPGYSHLVAAAASIGKDVMPRLAAKLDLMPVTDIIAIHGPNRFDRPIYAGNAIETVRSDQPQQVLTLRASAFAPPTAKRVGAGAPIEPVSTDGLPVAPPLVAVSRSGADRLDLATARIVVGGGVAVGSAENFALIESLAARLGAAVGATRAAVDAGYAPNDWQVGQTGKIIAPDLYVAIGISGALQHLAGLQGAKTIIAINSDPDAPLMQLADYRLVGDLFTVIPALLAELQRLAP